MAKSFYQSHHITADDLQSTKGGMPFEYLSNTFLVHSLNYCDGNENVTVTVTSTGKGESFDVTHFFTFGVSVSPPVIVVVSNE